MIGTATGASVFERGSAPVLGESVSPQARGLTLLHQYDARNHLASLFECHPGPVTFERLDPCLPLWHAMLGRTGLDDALAHAWRSVDVLSRLKTVAPADNLTVVGLAPHHPLLPAVLWRLQGQPVIYFTSWAEWSPARRSWARRRLLQAGVDAVQRWASGVATVNLAAYRFWSARKPCALVEHAIDTQRFDRRTRRTAAPSRLIYVGRLTRYKNLIAAVDAAGAAGMRLDIVGPTRDVSRDLLRREWVSVLGPRPQSWLAEHLSQYDGLVLVSEKREQYGIVLLEAMAAGLPLLVTRTFGTETILRDWEYPFMAESDRPVDIARLFARFRAAAAHELTTISRRLARTSQQYSHAAGYERWRPLIELANSDSVAIRDRRPFV